VSFVSVSTVAGFRGICLIALSMLLFVLTKSLVMSCLDSHIFINDVKVEGGRFYDTGVEGAPIYLPIIETVFSFGGVTGGPDGWRISLDDPTPLLGQRISIIAHKGEIINTIGCTNFFINNTLVELDYKLVVREDMHHNVYAPIRFFVE